MEHTKEPWFITETPPNHILSATKAIAIENEEWSICAVWRDAGKINEPEENARRIVACVNACAGLDTFFVEQTSMLGLVRSYSNQCAIDNAIEEQRDELLAAMKKMRPFIEEGDVPECFWSEPFKSALADFDAAIAKCET